MSHRTPKIILLIVLATFGAGAWFGAQVANRPPAVSNAIQVDGTTYPYTAAGVQAAINALNPPQGMGGSVMLPAVRIDLGSTGLTMRSHVCLIGVSTDSTWLTYNGPGTAITFPNRMLNSCLRQLTVALGGSAGPNAQAIDVHGDFNSRLETIYNKIQDVSVYSSIIHPGQIGIHLSGGGVPSSIQLSWFDTIKIANLDHPIVADGEEGNFWSNILVSGFSSVGVSDAASADNFWQLRITGSPLETTSAVGFQEAGSINQIRVTCDMGRESLRACVNDTGGRNIWDVSTVSPLGRFASSSFARIVGGAKMPSEFLVPK